MDSYLGVGYYAIQHKDFPYQEALHVFDGVKRPALAFVWGTFGDKQDGLKEWFRQVKDRPHLLEIHMMNQVCVRNGNCGVGEIWPGLSVRQFNNKLKTNDPELMDRIRTRVQEIKTFVDSQKNENSHLVLSLGLEDNFNKQAATNLERAVEEIWPYEIARNPVAQKGVDQSLSGADALELHTPNPKFGKGVQGIANLDGTDIDFSNREPTLSTSISPDKVRSFLSRNKGKSLAVFLWSALHQGLKKTSASAPPPRKRNPQVPKADVAEMRKWLQEAQK